ALAYALRVTIAPDVRRQYALMASIDGVAHRLAGQVRPDRPAVEPMAFEDLPPPCAITRIRQRRSDVEMVPPSGQLMALEFPRATLMTSASARREVVSPASKVTPAHEQNASSKFSPDRKSVDQRPASSRMC